MPTSLGLHSPRLDAVRALRTKRGRQEQGRFAVEGATLLAEGLAAGRRPQAVYATERGAGSLPALEPDLPLFIVPERAMARLSDLETPPGVLSVFSTALAGLDTLLADGDAVVLLAGVSDPGNAGTLLRSAEIFGVTRAVFARDGVEPHNSKVVRATMGALFRMSLALAEPDELLAAAGRNGYTIVAAMREGIALPAFRFPSRPLIAIGNERRGVGGWLPRWDAAVSIPQQGNAESLNAAVAGGILLYAFSQRSEAIHERPKSPENA